MGKGGVRPAAFRLIVLVAALHGAAGRATPYQEGSSPISRCNLNDAATLQISDVQTEIRSALGEIATSSTLLSYDLNNDGVVNVVDIQIELDAVLGYPCAADSTAPTITAISPPFGKTGQTVTITVTGQGLSGAIFALQSVDPSHSNGATSITILSESGTSATLSVVLGSQGGYNIVATNYVGTSQTNASSPVFVITSAATQNATAVASVLNTAFNTANTPALKTGQNKAAFYASVLNTDFNLANTPALPSGHNDITFNASVLNTDFNLTATPVLPAGRSDVAFFASVLNTAYNTANTPVLPRGQNAAATLAVSVCNTDSGCTANTSATVMASLARVPPVSTTPPAREMNPVGKRTSVTAGQTIHLTAGNAEPGSRVEFEVNQAIIATVTRAPYETLFTVPEMAGELTFQTEVEDAGQEQLSPIIPVTVLADSAAEISGRIAEGTGGMELSLAGGGLRAEFYHLPQPAVGQPSLEGLRPVRTGYVTAINQPNPRSLFGDDPLGALLGSDYAVRFSGEVQAETAGEYHFWLTARSGAAIRIDGQTRADSGFSSSGPAEATVSVQLARGWHSLEVIYYLAVGAASVRLEWQPPQAARREVVGPENLRTALEGMHAVSAADGSFVFRAVPARFDSVWIRMKSGDQNVEFSAVKPGASGVSLSLSK